MYGGFRWCLVVGALLVIVDEICATDGAEGNSGAASSGFETVHTSNAAILNRLGLAPLQIPDGHHKKRLAGPEPPGLRAQTRIHQPYSRRHGQRDSHVYIVKLPASPPYYTITKPHKAVKSDKLSKKGSNLPVGFQGNGKPAKIYHWNLPVVKKIGEKKRLHAQLRIDQARKKFEESKKRSDVSEKHLVPNLDSSYHQAIDNKLPGHPKYSAAKHTRNNDKRLSYPETEPKKPAMTRKANENILNKAYRLEDSNVHRVHLSNELHASRNSVLKLKKHRKKAAMSYYAPIAASTTKIHKNFPGNGKPKAFYVMEKSRKPVYYHPLLP